MTILKQMNIFSITTWMYLSTWLTNECEATHWISWDSITEDSMSLEGDRLMLTLPTWSQICYSTSGCEPHSATRGKCCKNASVLCFRTPRTCIELRDSNGMLHHCKCMCIRLKQGNKCRLLACLCEWLVCTNTSWWDIRPTTPFFSSTWISSLCAGATPAVLLSKWNLWALEVAWLIAIFKQPWTTVPIILWDREHYVMP